MRLRWREKLRGWAGDYRYAAWRQLEGALTRVAPEQVPTNESLPPIVMVPGIYESWSFLRPLAQALADRGHRVYFAENLAFHTMEIPAAAIEVWKVIDRHNLQDVVIVAHSKGGLVGKYLLVHLDPKRSVRRVIAIATPFSGSVYALAWVLPSVRTFAPTSRLIRGLKKELEANRRIVSIYPAFDPHIPGGSRLEGAVNIKVRSVGHFRILEDPEVVAAVEKWAAKG